MFFPISTFKLDKKWGIKGSKFNRFGLLRSNAACGGGVQYSMASHKKKIIFGI